MVGKRIKQYLIDNGIKMSFLADKVGIDQPRMSAICNNGRVIDCVLYYKICKVLDVPFETFLEEEEA